MSVLRTGTCATALVIGVGLVVALGACAEDESPCPSALTTSTSTSTSTTGSGNGGGGTGGGGTGGSSSSSGTAGGGGIPTSDVACVGDYAFRAAGMSFAQPTPQALAEAFNELAYEYGDHPITLVLRSTDPQQATVAASATDEDQNTYMDSFFAGLEPTFTEATVAQGSFWSNSPQATGYLRFRHNQGFLELELNNLMVHASTSSDCNQALVTLDVTIPADERSKALTYSGGSTTVGDLGGGSATDPIQLHALFMTEAISFDWASLD